MCTFVLFILYGFAFIFVERVFLSFGVWCGVVYRLCCRGKRHLTLGTNFTSALIKDGNILEYFLDSISEFVSFAVCV